MTSGRIVVLPYGRRRPRKGADGLFQIFIRRSGPGAGKFHTVMPLPKGVHWPEVKAVRRWLRTMPADTSLAALQTGAGVVTAPMVTARTLRAAGASPETIRVVSERVCAAEWGEAPADHHDGYRMTHIQPTGRWVGADGKVFVGDVPSDMPLPDDLGALVRLRPVEAVAVQ